MTNTDPKDIIEMLSFLFEKLSKSVSRYSNFLGFLNNYGENDIEIILKVNPPKDLSLSVLDAEGYGMKFIKSGKDLYGLDLLYGEDDTPDMFRAETLENVKHLALQKLHETENETEAKIRRIWGQ